MLGRVIHFLSKLPIALPANVDIASHEVDLTRTISAGMPGQQSRQQGTIIRTGQQGGSSAAQCLRARHHRLADHHPLRRKPGSPGRFQGQDAIQIVEDLWAGGDHHRGRPPDPYRLDEFG